MYWTVLNKEEYRGTNKYLFCKCICGTTKFVRESRLRNGKSTSCGCATYSNRKIKHGRTRSPEYRSWEAMKNRCLNPKAHNFHRYGGRGINICTRWLKFSNFLEDMRLRPKGTTLGRINNNGNYEPFNVAWQTKKEQLEDKEDIVLNYKIAAEIRENLNLGFTGKELKLKYGVNASTISMIKHNRIWV